MSVLNKPRIEAYIGASGSGKGVSINHRLRELKPARLLIWDPRDEYEGHAKPYSSLTDLLKSVRGRSRAPFKARFVPGSGANLGDAFGLLCDVAFTAGEMVFLAEELSDTTTASHAPAAWRRVITQGRHKGLHVIGAAQRPALIDKTFLGNATYIRCFTLRYRDDRLAMSRALDVPEAEVSALQTVEDELKGKTEIQYIERDFRSGVCQRGRIVLRR